MTESLEQQLVVTRITAFDQEMILACDGRCDKAWGINTRPSISFDEQDHDDQAWLSDDELEIAPEDPGTYEGFQAKPPPRVLPSQPIHNKWCFRECERSTSCKVSEFPSISLSNFSKRVYNEPWKHND